MSFRSMIQEMKVEIGAISRHGVRSRSHRSGLVQRVAAVEPADALRQSCSAPGAPAGGAGEDRGVGDVMAAPPGRGCVRRRLPELEGHREGYRAHTGGIWKAHFPHLSQAGAYTCGPVVVHGTGHIPRNVSRSNFLGTKFTVYDAHPPYAGAVVSKSRSARMIGSNQVSPRVPAGNYPVSHISYELNVLGSRGPRRMHCVMDSIPVSAIEQGGTAPTRTEFPFSNRDSFASIPFFKSKSSRVDSSTAPLSTEKESKLALKNKSPRWHEHLQCWCLNFHGRVTVASVKNFQLVASDESGPTNQEHDDVTLQFGKIGKDLFTMDYRYPISAFQAFAICLSSFDTKIACE